MKEIGDYLYYPKRIGRGSYSQVFKGYHKDTLEPVAIKKIDLFAISKLAEQLKAEIEIMKQVDHPNILKLYDTITDENDEYLYLILEYCKHGDLAYYIKKRPLNEEYARKYMQQMSSALQHLYARNIMHRDIKPHNVLLADKDTVKLSDFGFARIVEENQMIETLCGSPLYMAPEICNNMQYTIKADLWSIGVLLYEMVTGNPPYCARNHLELIKKLMREEFRFPSYLAISPECKELITRLLTKDPEDRINWDDFFHHVWLRPTIDEDNDLLRRIDSMFSPTRAGKKVTNILNEPYAEDDADLFDHVSPGEFFSYGFDEELSDNEGHFDSTPYHSALDILPTRQQVGFTMQQPSTAVGTSLPSKPPSPPIDIKRRTTSLGGGETMRYEMLPTDVFYQGINEDGFQIINTPIEFHHYHHERHTPSSLPDTVMSYMNSSIKYMKSWFN